MFINIIIIIIIIVVVDIVIIVIIIVSPVDFVQRQNPIFLQ